MSNRQAIKQLTTIVKNMAERLIHSIDPETDEAGIYGDKCEWCHQLTSVGTDILHEMSCPIRQAATLLIALGSDDDAEGSIGE